MARQPKLGKSLAGLIKPKIKGSNSRVNNLLNSQENDETRDNLLEILPQLAEFFKNNQQQATVNPLKTADKRPAINSDLIRSLIPEDKIEAEQEVNDELKDDNTYEQEVFDLLTPEELQTYKKEYEDSGSDNSFFDYFKETIMPRIDEELKDILENPQEDEQDLVDVIKNDIQEQQDNQESEQQDNQESEDDKDEAEFDQEQYELDHPEEFYTEEELDELLKEYDEADTDKDFDNWLAEKQSNDEEFYTEEEFDDLLKQYQESGTDKSFEDWDSERIERENEELAQEEENNEEFFTEEEEAELLKEYEESGSDKDFEDWVKDKQNDDYTKQLQDYINDLPEEDQKKYREEYENSGSKDDFIDYFEKNILPTIPDDEEELQDAEDEVADEQDAVENEEQAVEDVKDVAQDPVEKQELQDEENVLADEDQSLQAEKEAVQDTEQEQSEALKYLSGLSEEESAPYMDEWINSGSTDDFSTYFANDIFPALELPGNEEVPGEQSSFQDTPLADINDLFQRNNNNLLPNISPELRQAYQKMQQNQDTPLEPAENLFRQQNRPAENQFENQKQQIGAPQNLSGSLAPTLQNASQGQVVSKPQQNKTAARNAVQQRPLTKKEQKQQAKRQAAQQKAQKTSQLKAQKQQQAEALQSGRPVPYGSQQQATWRKSTSDQPVSIRTTTPQQDVALNSLYNRIPQGIANLNFPGQQSNFAPIANEARRNFSQKTIPSLAERFAGMGDNRLQSSGFAQALGGAAGDFESQLAAQQAQYGLQEQAQQSNNLFNSLGSFLRPQFDYTIAPGQNSGIRNAWNSVKQPLTNAAAGYFAGGGGLTGIPGAVAGAASGLIRGNNQNQQQPLYNNAGLGQNNFEFNNNQMPYNNPDMFNNYQLPNSQF